MVFALTALLLAVALPAQAQTDAADPVLSVVVAEGQAPVTIAWSQLEGHLDANPVAYAKGQKKTPKGIYLESALTLAGLPLQTYSSVLSADGSGVALDKADLIRHAGVLFRAEDGTLRLLRSSAAQSAGGERLQQAVGGALALRLVRNPELISSMPEVVPGGELTFYASIPSQLDPATVTYQWDFNDDAKPQTTTEPSVAHAFQARNRQDTPYNVSVTFFVNGKRYGEMLPLITTVTVVVAERYQGIERDADNGSAQTAGGNTGVRDGEKRRTETPPAAESVETPYTPPATVTPSPTPSTPTATPTPTPTPPPSQPRRTPRARRRTPAPTPAAPAGETVDGYLLASADVPVSAGGAAAQQARATARGLPQPDEEPLHVPTPMWVAIGLLALVVLGWGLESRTTLPYFRP